MDERIRGKTERRVHGPRVPSGPPLPKGPLELTLFEKQVIRLLLHERLQGKQMAFRLKVNRWKIKDTLCRLYDVLELRTWGSAQVRLWLWAFYNPEFNPDAPERPDSE